MESKKTDKEKKHPLGARIPEELFRLLKMLAAREGTTMQALVEEAVSDLLEKHSAAITAK